VKHCTSQSASTSSKESYNEEKKRRKEVAPVWAAFLASSSLAWREKGGKERRKEGIEVIVPST